MTAILLGYVGLQIVYHSFIAASTPILMIYRAISRYFTSCCSCSPSAPSVAAVCAVGSHLLRLFTCVLSYCVVLYNFWQTSDAVKTGSRVQGLLIHANGGPCIICTDYDGTHTAIA